MRRFFLVPAVLAGLALVPAFAQTRTDDFDATGVTTTVVQLWPLADGGCQARACGEARSTDGGATERECTDAFDVKATVNVNRCNALKDAFAGRLQRALRFDADAGAP